MSQASPGRVGPKSNPPTVSGTLDTTSSTDVVQERTSENPLGLDTSGLASSGQAAEAVSTSKDNTLTLRLEANTGVAEGQMKCASPNVASTMTGLINVSKQGKSASFTAISGGDPNQAAVVINPPGSERITSEDEKVISDNRILWEAMLKNQTELQNYVDAMGNFIAPHAVPLCVGVQYGERAMRIKDHFILGRCEPLNTRAIDTNVTWFGTPLHDTVDNFNKFEVSQSDVALGSILLLLKYLRLRNILIMDASSYVQTIESMEREFLRVLTTGAADGSDAKYYLGGDIERVATQDLVRIFALLGFDLAMFNRDIRDVIFPCMFEAVCDDKLSSYLMLSIVYDTEMYKELCWAEKAYHNLVHRMKPHRKVLLLCRLLSWFMYFDGQKIHSVVPPHRLDAKTWWSDKVQSQTGDLTCRKVKDNLDKLYIAEKIKTTHPRPGVDVATCEAELAKVEDHLVDIILHSPDSKSDTSDDNIEDEGLGLDPTILDSPPGSRPQSRHVSGDEGDDLNLNDLEEEKPKTSTPKPPTPSTSTAQSRNTMMSPATDLAGMADNLHLGDVTPTSQDAEMENLSNNAGGNDGNEAEAANPEAMDTREKETHDRVEPDPVPNAQDRVPQDRVPQASGGGQSSAVQFNKTVPKAVRDMQPQMQDDDEMDGDSEDDAETADASNMSPPGSGSSDEDEEDTYFSTELPRNTCPDDHSSLWYIGSEMDLPLPRITRVDTTPDSKMEDKLNKIVHKEIMACVTWKSAKDIKKNVERPVQQTYMPCILWKPYLRLRRWRKEKFSLRNHWVPQQVAPFPFGHALVNESAKSSKWYTKDYFDLKSQRFVCEAWRFGMWYYAQKHPFDVAIQQPVFKNNMVDWFKENVKDYKGHYHALIYWDGSYTLWYKGQLVSFSHMQGEDLTITHLFPDDLVGMHRYSIEAERRMDKYVDEDDSSLIGVYVVKRTSQMPFYDRILKEAGPYRWHSLQDRRISIMSFALMADNVQDDIEIPLPYVEPGVHYVKGKPKDITKSVYWCEPWDDENHGIVCPVKNCKIFRWYDDKMLFYWHWQIIHQGVNGFHRCLAMVPLKQGNDFYRFKAGELEAPKVDGRGRPKAVVPCYFTADTKRTIRNHYTNKHHEGLSGSQIKTYWEGQPHGGSKGCDAISLDHVNAPANAPVREVYMNPGEKWVWLWNDRTDTPSGTAYPSPSMPEWEVLKLDCHKPIGKPSELWKNIDRMDDTGIRAVRKYNLSRAYARLLKKGSCREGDEDPDNLMVYRREWSKGQKKVFDRQLAEQGICPASGKLLEDRDGKRKDRSPPSDDSSKVRRTDRSVDTSRASTSSDKSDASNSSKGKKHKSSSKSSEPKDKRIKGDSGRSATETEESEDADDECESTTKAQSSKPKQVLPRLDIDWHWVRSYDDVIEEIRRCSKQKGRGKYPFKPCKISDEDRGAYSGNDEDGYSTGDERAVPSKFLPRVEFVRVEDRDDQEQIKARLRAAQSEDDKPWDFNNGVIKLTGVTRAFVIPNTWPRMNSQEKYNTVYNHISRSIKDGKGYIVPHIWNTMAQSLKEDVKLMLDVIHWSHRAGIHFFYVQSKNFHPCNRDRSRFNFTKAEEICLQWKAHCPHPPRSIDALLVDIKYNQSLYRNEFQSPCSQQGWIKMHREDRQHPANQARLRKEAETGRRSIIPPPSSAPPPSYNTTRPAAAAPTPSASDVSVPDSAPSTSSYADVISQPPSIVNLPPPGDNFLPPNSLVVSGFQIPTEEGSTLPIMTSANLQPGTLPEQRPDLPEIDGGPAGIWVNELPNSDGKAGIQYHHNWDTPVYNRFAVPEREGRDNHLRYRTASYVSQEVVDAARGNRVLPQMMTDIAVVANKVNQMQIDVAYTVHHLTAQNAALRRRNHELEGTNGKIQEALMNEKAAILAREKAEREAAQYQAERTILQNEKSALITERDHLRSELARRPESMDDGRSVLDASLAASAPGHRFGIPADHDRVLVPTGNNEYMVVQRDFRLMSAACEFGRATCARAMEREIEDRARQAEQARLAESDQRRPPWSADEHTHFTWAWDRWHDEAKCNDYILNTYKPKHEEYNRQMRASIMQSSAASSTGMDSPRRSSTDTPTLTSPAVSSLASSTAASGMSPRAASAIARQLAAANKSAVDSIRLPLRNPGGFGRLGGPQGVGPVMPSPANRSDTETPMDLDDPFKSPETPSKHKKKKTRAEAKKVAKQKKSKGVAESSERDSDESQD